VKILFLDDNESRHAQFEYEHQGDSLFKAYTVQEAINFLKDNSPFDIVYLDHDLGPVVTTSNSIFPASTEDTGYEVARYISIMSDKLRPKEVIVHSWNPAGAARMRDILVEADVHVSYKPFTIKN